MSAPTITRLIGPQTAATNCCGSCKFFTRGMSDAKYPEYAQTRGNCGFKFPPWVKLLHKYAQIGSKSNHMPEGVEFFENSSDVTRVIDNEGCSLWQSSGTTFVKDVTWVAGVEPNGS